MLLCPITLRASDKSYPTALQKATEAFYIQSGLSDSVTKISNKYQEKYLPTFVRDNAGLLMFINDSIANNRILIKYKWSIK